MVEEGVYVRGGGISKDLISCQASAVFTVVVRFGSGRDLKKVFHGSGVLVIK